MPAESPQLLRLLGLGTGIALVVGQVIGSGIFAKPGMIARELGDLRLILLSWVMGGGLCVLGGLCFAELAAMLPRAGGLYVYLREAYGPLAGFLFGWNEVLFNRPAASGALSIIFAASLVRVCGLESGPMTQALVASSLILLLAWLNVRGVRLGGNVQVATTLVKAGFVALVATLPFVLLPFGWSSFSFENWSTTSIPQSDGSLLARLGVVMLGVMWAYNGWHGVTPVAEEIHRPERNIPIALLGGIGLLMLFYLGANLAYHGLLTTAEVAAAGEHAAEEAIGRLLGPIGAAALSAVIMSSTLGAINGDLLLAPRISFAMARDGLFFRQLAEVHPVYRTPTKAIALQAAMAISLILGTGLLVAFVPHFSQASIFELLTNFVVFAASIFYVMGALAVLILRRKRPQAVRPYRAWGGPVAPLIFLLIYAWFLSEVYRGRPFEARTGLLLIAAGIPVYYFFAARLRARAASAAPSPTLALAARSEQV